MNSFSASGESCSNDFDAVPVFREPATPFCAAAANMVKPRQAGTLVKMNLPPLMGRRDAAYDAASELMTGSLFPENVAAARRVASYIPLLNLLEAAERDTRSLLAVLSSPDTEARERRQLAYLTMLKSAVMALRSFAELEAWGFGTVREGGTEPGTVAVPGAAGDVPLLETERTIINQLKNFFERSRTQILRYRDYAGKNFSTANAERYNRAYRANIAIYHQDNKDNPEDHE